MAMSGKISGGKAIYGASVGILMLEARFPRIPGDMGNALTWPFPVHYKVVRSASPDRVVRQGAEGLLDVFIAAARELVADGVVVAREYGYNRRAEALREPAVESGAVAREQVAIPPLRPGETDLFRMMFLRGDVPRFDEWRVRVEAATPSRDDAGP